MSKITIRGGFSDRSGIKPISTDMQINSLDNNTRADLCNVISDHYSKGYKLPSEKDAFLIHVIRNAFHEPIQTNSSFLYKDKVYDQYITCVLLEGDFDEVFTLIEFLGNELFSYQRQFFNSSINKVLENNYVGYRLLESKICPITSELEIQTIQSVCQKGVSVHIKKAIEYLSDRKQPDYENSIKESITAVEAMCNIIVGNGKATLGEALKQIKERGVEIHPALESSFKAIYGYTSDANGIRHSGDIGGPNSTFEEARFMLVSCSAFINYLKICSGKKS